MKKSIKTIGITFLIIFCSLRIYAQESSSDMPGDNFSLEGALALFKKSNSIENFEELLNSNDNEVNNLDLDENGEVDFIRIESQKENDMHAITLQVAINKKESQDIAVIAIEKDGMESATLQIIGDEEVYGEETIVEPFEVESQSDGKGPNADYTLTRVVVNVWLWPSVRYIYRPSFRVYVSPWYWGVYPRWWTPWRPVSLRLYRPRVSRWSYGYRVTPTIRVVNARRIYTPRRRTSVTVVNNYKVRKTNYVSHRSRTVVTQSNNKTVVRKSSSKTLTKDGNKKTGVNKNSKKAVSTNGKTKVKGKKSTKTKVIKSKNTKTKVKKTKTKKTKVKKKR